jgi:hypothetical protein
LEKFAPFSVDAKPSIVEFLNPLGKSGIDETVKTNCRKEKENVKVTLINLLMNATSLTSRI